MNKHHHKPYHRVERIKEQLLREIALQVRNLKDPRFGIFTLTDAVINKDYSLAKIYYTVLEDDKRDDTQKAFDAAKGRLRSELSHKISIFHMPELEFIYDKSEEQARVVDALLAQAAAESPIED